jgi:hypothetical protein
MFRAQADWTLILRSELPTKELGQLPRKMPLQAYHRFLNTWCDAAAFFSASGAALSQEFPTVLKRLSDQPEL